MLFQLRRILEFPSSQNGLVGLVEQELSVQRSATFPSGPVSVSGCSPVFRRIARGSVAELDAQGDSAQERGFDFNLTL